MDGFPPWQLILLSGTVEARLKERGFQIRSGQIFRVLWYIWYITSEVYCIFHNRGLPSNYDRQLKEAAVVLCELIGLLCPTI